MAEQPKTAKKEAGDKKGGNMPLFAIIGAVLVLNILVAGKIYLGGGGGKAASKPPAASDEIGPKMALDEFLVNLAGSSDHYLKVTVALGLKKDLTEEKLKDDVAPIRDVIIRVLSSKPAEELATTDGKEKLKTELKDQINGELHGDKIMKVYFMSFATQ